MVSGCTINLVPQQVNLRNTISTNKIKFKPNESIAGKIVEYLNIHFRSSQDDAITRYFYELPVADVKVHPSLIDTLKTDDERISEYQSCLIKPGNKIKFRIIFVKIVA